MLCPSCGYANAAGATHCAQCGRDLRDTATPPQPTTHPPSPPTEAQNVLPFIAPPNPAGLPYAVPVPTATPLRGREFLLGLFLGSLPFLLGLIGLGSSLTGRNNFSEISNLLLVSAGVGYLAEIIAAIVCLIIQRTRTFGYGLLTMVFVNPILIFVGCVVILSSSFSR